MRALWASQPVWNEKEISLQVRIAAKSQKDLPDTAIIKVMSKEYYTTPWSAKPLKNKIKKVTWKDITTPEVQGMFETKIPWSKKEGCATELMLVDFIYGLEVIYHDF